MPGAVPVRQPTAAEIAEQYGPDDLLFDPLKKMTLSLRGRDRGTIELLQHLHLELEGGEEPHLKNTRQTPLDSYYRANQLVSGTSQSARRDNRAFWVAGRRLRGIWDRAGHKARLTANLMSAGRGGRSGTVEAPDAMLDAWQALAEALEFMPATPRLCTIAVCCTDVWARDWAATRPWPKPDGAIEVLRTGLEFLHERFSWIDSIKAERDNRHAAGS